MARGRKPKPIELREAEENPGRRPLPAPLPSSGELVTEPPAMLGDDGAQLWREMTVRLGSVGALDAVDRAALTAMCLQWDRSCEAARVLDEQGHYARGSMGQLVAHPALAVERASHVALLKFAAEYAATPVARARVATAQSAQAQQRELESFISAEPLEIDDLGVIEDGEIVDGSD